MNSSEVMTRLPDMVNQDPALVRRGRWLSNIFLVEAGTTQFLVHVDKGRLLNVEHGPFVMPSWSFAIRASESVWQRFWQPLPAPGDNDIFALRKTGEMSVEGNLQPFMANLIYIKQVLAMPRALMEGS
jgi:hypothetical protein|tara:strand:- start:2428 stop:2811 length:384 start_codon:yes stop_codon:yes gene_type:complete